MDFQEPLNNIESLKNYNSHDSTMTKVKSTVKGSAIGLALGLMYGWYYHKNLYVYGIIGALGGGAFNYFLLNND